MACMNAFCKRLKAIFSSEKSSCDSKVAAQSSSGCCCCCRESSVNTSESLTIADVNPYVTIDETVLAVTRFDKDEDEDRGDGRHTKNKCKGLRISKVLRFSTSDSYSISKDHQQTCASCSIHSLSFTLSTQSLPQSPTALVSCSSGGRYKRDFQVLELLGSGEFGSVYRCLNRLDGCVYAVKRSRPLLAKSIYAQRRARNEVHANAALNNHRHVVRYYAAWIEDDCMSIQQEYCNGGDLAEIIAERSRNALTSGGIDEMGDAAFEERELCRLLIHVAEGLRYIHGAKLAHMDIKPENIFISRERTWTGRERDGCRKSEGKMSQPEEEIIYKIGDLGHVTPIANTQELEDEGDCRYLPKEILREDYTDLTKADVFALGLTIYEAGGGGPLPKNGPTWHNIRDGNLKRLPRYSNDLNELIRRMIHLNPEKRPSAIDLVQREFLLV